MAKDILTLVINFGSTSTKLAIYKNEEEQEKVNIEHDRAVINSFKVLNDEIPFRKQVVLDFLKERNLEITDFDVIAPRAGNMAKVNPGTYRVNKLMVDRLTNRPAARHVCNLCAIVGYELAEPHGIPCFVSDAPSVDQMLPENKITGIPEITKYAGVHGENMKAVANKTAEKLGKKYEDCNFIICHMGGGITFSMHRHGEIIDAYCDDVASFSPERAGILPSVELIELCFSGKYTEEELKRYMRGRGGVLAHLGTASMLEVEKRIKDGDKHAKLIYDALLVNIAKSIAGLATNVDGEVDSIILTGGMAHSNYVVSTLERKLKFICPLVVIPGEFEVEHMALCALKAYRGEIEAQEYTD